MAEGGLGSGRIHYLDWLRAAAVVGVVAYHALLPFGTSKWHVNNAERSEVLTAALLVFETFGLGLLFLVAGASARFALRRRSPPAFLSERGRRILVPFVVGTFLLTPPMMYLAAVHDASTSESLPAFLAGWPAGAIAWAAETGVSPRLFSIGFHLWFLGYLFAFSALGLPVFALLASTRGRRLVKALGRLARWPGATLAFALPIALPPLLLLAPAPDEFDWWQFGWYGAYFLAGYIIYGDDRLIAAARRDLLPALTVGLAALAGLLVADFGGWVAAHEGVGYVYDLTYLVMILMYAIGGWAWTLVLLNVGLRMGALQRPLPRAVGEGVLPLYVLHLPVVLIVAFVVLTWPLGLLPKALIVMGASLALSAAITATALRISPARLLLGVGHGRSSAAAQPRGALDTQA
jgi:glucan biosynthesis protein C